MTAIIAFMNASSRIELFLFCLFETGKTKPFHMPALGRFPSKNIHTLKVYRKFSFHLYIRVKNDILN